MTRHVAAAPGAPMDVLVLAGLVVTALTGLVLALWVVPAVLVVVLAAAADEPV